MKECSGETWAALQKHISPVAVFQMKLLAVHMWHLFARPCAKGGYTEYFSCIGAAVK